MRDKPMSSSLMAEICSINSRSTSAERSSTVGCSNRCRTSIGQPNAARSLDTAETARSECPPRAKKLSRKPTWLTPSNSIQIWAITTSVGDWGATYSVAASSSGEGSALVSTLPGTVSGSAPARTAAA